MFIPKHVLINLLMSSRRVGRLAKRWHSTGINRDPRLVREAYAFYRSKGSVEGKSILELGPGQTIDMLACALEEGAASCSAVDTVRYVSDREAKSRRIDLRIYDGGVLPYAEGSFDRLWATDVLEHLRRPALTMREAHRVLKPEGLFICRVDLRDHYHLEEESNWLDCMRYSERLWRAMTWHRSSYVNRLRYSAWFRLFQEAGFASREVRTIEDNKLYDIYSGALWARDFDRADIIVYRFEVVLEKH